MFDQTFVNARAETRKPWTVGLSLALQTGLVAIALIVPLLHPEILHPKIDMPVFVTLRPLKQPPTEVRSKTLPTKSAPHVFVGPTRIPQRIATIADISSAAEPDTFAIAGALPDIGASGIIPGLSSNIIADAPPSKPRPAVKPQPVPSGPVAVSTGVQAAKLIFGPRPSYPPLAKASRTQGTVKLQAIVAADGTIRNLHVMSGPPLLTRAAIDSVQQWRYRPTLLSGTAVEVITEIDVVFTLN
jgi:protein TonB